MKSLILAALSIIIVMDIYSQNKPDDRQPVAAGRFYPAGKETLTRDLTKLFADCKKSGGNMKVRAIISPHAGYVYSGSIAAAAFSTTPRNAEYENIFVIGSSHVMAFNGASVYYYGDFITPLGKAGVNRDIAAKLRNENKIFNFPADAHTQDHSLEVQIPFIQHYYTHPQNIVPIIIGTNNTKTIKSIAEALRPWFTPANLFVISSDFSHYPSYNDAVLRDNMTAEGLISGNPGEFLEVLRKNSSANVPGLSTSMCGWTSGLMLLYLTEGNKELEYINIDYCNSGDSPYGGKTEVVGYHAITVTEKNGIVDREKYSSDELNFTEDEKENLFSIARNSIITMLYDHRKTEIDEKKIPEALCQTLGAFVTLKVDGVLRGCIGRFTSSDPLCEVVNASALSSAFEDPRFPPLSKQEYAKAEIEITVLGPLKKISSINEITLGKHGIYIKKDSRSGTMLPQVATENGWNVEQFLGYTSRDKAGIGWEGWKEAEIFIYEGKVLEENRK